MNFTRCFQTRTRRVFRVVQVVHELQVYTDAHVVLAPEERGRGESVPYVVRPGRSRAVELLFVSAASWYTLCCQEQPFPCAGDDATTAAPVE